MGVQIALLLTLILVQTVPLDIYSHQLTAVQLPPLFYSKQLVRQFAIMAIIQLIMFANV